MPSFKPAYLIHGDDHGRIGERRARLRAWVAAHDLTVAVDGLSFKASPGRVLGFLGPESRLGWLLAFANLALAVAQFAEPVLFGKIVDVLSGKPQTGPLASNSAWPLLAAWVAFPS